MAVVRPITENSQQPTSPGGARTQAANFNGTEQVTDALGRLGQQGGEYAEAQNLIEIQTAETLARQRDAEATQRLMALGTEGETSFFNLRGEAAVQAAPNFLAQVDEEERRIAGKIGPNQLAQRMFRDVRQRRRTALQAQVNEHRATQWTAWQDETDTTTLETDGAELVQTAASSALVDNPEIMAHAEGLLANIETTVARQAARRGVTEPEQIAQLQRTETGRRLEEVIDSVRTERSALAADDLITRFERYIDPRRVNDLREALRDGVSFERAEAGEYDVFNVYEGEAPAAVESEAPVAGAAGEGGTAAAAPRAASALPEVPAPASDARAPTRPAAPGRIRATGTAGALAQALSSQGLPAVVVAGFLGNIQVESSFNPRLSGDSGSAHGYVQWRHERVTNFQRVVGTHPRDASPAQTAQFIKWELDNPGRAGMTVAQRNAILAARSPEQAARLIDAHYERSNGAHRGQRASNARRFYAGGDAPDGGGQDGGTGGYALGEAPAQRRLDVAATRRRIMESALPPREKQQVLRHLDQQVQRQEQAIARGRNVLEESAAAAVVRLGDGFTDMSQLPPALLAQLPTHPELALRLQATAQSNGRAARAESREAEEEVREDALLDYTEMRNSTDPRERQRFLDTDFRTAPNLSPAQRRQLMDQQAALRPDQLTPAQAREAQDRVQVNLDRVHTYVDRYAPHTTSGAVSDTERRARARLVDRVTERVRVLQQTPASRGGIDSQVDDEALREIVASEAQIITVQTSGTFGTRSMQLPAYRARERRNEPGFRAIPQRPAEVPEAQYQAILQAYQRVPGNAGSIPTPEEVRRRYRQLRSGR